MQTKPLSNFIQTSHPAELIPLELVDWPGFDDYSDVNTMCAENMPDDLRKEIAKPEIMERVDMLDIMVEENSNIQSMTTQSKETFEELIKQP